MSVSLALDVKGFPLHNSIEIRQGDHRDVADVMKTICACTEAMRSDGIFQWDEIHPNKEQVEDDANEGSLYVARKTGICLGAVSFNEKQEDVYQQVAWRGNGPMLVVHRLCVDPRFQGQGIARQLMCFGEGMALQRGYASIRLDAFSGNQKALGLYESLGYEKVGSVTFPRRNLPFLARQQNL
jgi:ribosomal protein S18 acetylase RimI-like enzyme